LREAASLASARILLIADEQYANVVRDVWRAFKGDVSSPQRQCE
jgi:hypothetical protein